MLFLDLETITGCWNKRTIGNASAHAVYKAQTAFEGAAEKMGVVNDGDIQALVDEVRYGK